MPSIPNHRYNTRHLFLLLNIITLHQITYSLTTNVVVVGSRSLSSSISNSSSNNSSNNNKMMMMTSSPKAKVIKISERIWRSAATQHSTRIKTLLQPGLTSIDHTVNSGRKNRGNQYRPMDDWTALDPVNPIYNFLIEYYGLKGAKGPRRLGRWAPDPNLLLLDDDDDDDGDGDDESHDMNIGRIITDDSDGQSTSSSDNDDDDDDGAIYKAAMEASHGLGGILLENANLDDFGGTLYMRGGVPVPIENDSMIMQQQLTTTTTTTTTATSSSTSTINNNNNNNNNDESQELHGILYNPAVFYNRHIPLDDDDDDDDGNNTKERRNQLLKTIAPFQWYSSILQTTLTSDPILHCYGLHEWAMQYHPPNSPPPPSAKYQSNNIPLRVSRDVINQTVERKGIRCTHVDALRFFAPAAGPLNRHGATLERMDQLRLEQKGCVHAHMDLLKIALKLQGFVDSKLVGDVLEVALKARTLDVEASPYDATGYGAGIVPIETNEGRKEYRERQILLMQEAEPVRERLADAYDGFMRLAFEEELLGGHFSSDGSSTGGGSNSPPYVAPERLAKAQPGGLPWRKNLIES